MKVILFAALTVIFGLAATVVSIDGSTLPPQSISAGASPNNTLTVPPPPAPMRLVDMYKQGFDDARANKPRSRYYWKYADYRKGYRHGLWSR